ncbi:TonB-dependent receptor [Parabacteroides sp. PF5-9]|uniref:TonB-dependent receptor n=1 Tax=Parabacteroides sp. PF5-9 TaxID=1742404 RepID=UPI002475DD0E|nr:TonB-dependent receptor [Parabacteroides sp. PF5-9]MDH6358085.1 hypothetical protein [Parabacteroides sp. PF5-9]
MKRLFLISVFWVILTALSAQHRITGTVWDEYNQPLSNVNIYIKETLEGGSSDLDGHFEFKTEASGTVTLCVMMLGYENWTQTGELPFPELTIKMRPSNLELDAVEVVASNFILKGSSQWKEMGAVDLVTTGGSVGDLYKSINTMPGTQMAGENGRLFIRGGESREAQTYIDDMHVLVPYTTTGSENTPVRGRYSPFMFEGMTFSLGGYDPEYGQGLSSVLPLQTKDESLVTKIGSSLTTVGPSAGGTKSFEEGSASFDFSYQNLEPYYAVVPDRSEWLRPYQKFSGGTQWRYNPNKKTVGKIYAAYDYTSLATREEDRRFDLKEHNYYLNTTLRHQTENGYKLFGGIAFSWLNSRIHGASVADDLFNNKEWEFHLKLKGEKRFSPLFKWQFGAETMQRGITEKYRSTDAYQQGIDHSINAVYTTGSFNFTEQLNASLSSRLEYTTANDRFNFLPRLTLNYNMNDFYLSAIAGRYTQLTYNESLLQRPGLPSESCWHYILGGYHQSEGRVYRVESYYKNYDRLVCDTDGQLDASGNGYSRGFDLFFNDNKTIRNLEYRFSYSWNDAKRKYRDYPVKDIPQYATQHNASVSLRYELKPLRSIIGVTDRFASGRPYHDPNKAGWMNATAPVYNSLDLSLTVLAHKRVIIFASVSNILNRKQVYNYSFSEVPDHKGRYTGTPVRSNADQFFFIGLFITLSGDTAYDVSNF